VKGRAIMKRFKLTKRAGRKSAAHGVTIVELILSMSLAVVLLSSLFVLYYHAAKGAVKEDNLASASREANLVTDRMSREFRLVGLMATQDVNGDANDIKRDVPGQIWSDSLRQDFEYANSFTLVFTGDIDNDGHTETVRINRNATTRNLEQSVWRWSRDSLRWTGPVTKVIGTSVDYLRYTYYDRDGRTVPNPSPVTEYTLTSGERNRVTGMEITVVTRSANVEAGSPEYTTLADGTTWHDGYRRVVQRFMVRGRNLSLGA
jgi:hypothetical protein